MVAELLTSLSNMFKIFVLNYNYFSILRWWHMVTISTRLHHCCHLLKNCEYSLYLTVGIQMPPHCPFPLMASGPHLIHVFLGPPESICKKTISINSAVLVQIMVVTNRHKHKQPDTQHTTSEATGHINALCAYKVA